MSSLYTTLRKEYIKEWRIWYRMIQLCEQKKEKSYIEVDVCEEWQGQEGFVQWLDDLGPRPAHCNTLSRKNKLADFEPGNVVWDTYTGRRKTQSHGTRERFDLRPFHDVRKQNNICYHTFMSRIRNGWNPQDAASIKPSSIHRYSDYLL